MISRSTRFLGGFFVLIAVACGDSSSAPPAANLEPDEVLADSLIGAWLEAAGGMDAWNDISSARYTIMTAWFDSAGEIRRMRPRRVEYRKVMAQSKLGSSVLKLRDSTSRPSLGPRCGLRSTITF